MSVEGMRENGANENISYLCTIDNWIFCVVIMVRKWIVKSNV